MGRARAAELPPDEVIQEILLRLPPHPASFHRASLVCKLWHRLLREPDFTRRFRARHRHAPPLIGFFAPDSSFAPAGDPPDRVTIRGHHSGNYLRVIGCRHGRVLSRTVNGPHLAIWYPTVRFGVFFPVPRMPQPDLDFKRVHGSLICVHGHDGQLEEDGCNSRPFRVVLLFYGNGCILAGVFPSRAWRRGLVSLAAPHDLFTSIKPGVLIGNTMYWLSPQHNKIVVFHLGTYQLHLIESLPTDSLGPFDYYQIIKAEGEEELGMATVRGSRLHLFALATKSAGAKWSQYRVVELNMLHGISPPVKVIEVTDEAVNTIFLEAGNGVFALNLETMDVNKVLSGVVFPTMIAYRSFDVTGSGGNEMEKAYSELVATI